MKTTAILTALLLVSFSVNSQAVQQKSSDNFPDKQINQDSIRRARESELRVDSYRQSPENAAKIKALIEKHEQKNQKDSVVVINGISCIIRMISNPTDKLHFLKDSEGKYPDDIGLLKKDVFKKRLKKLLGNRSKFLIKNFNVQTPIESIDNIYVSFGCQAHNCNDINFMIAYDFSNNVLHVGIREDEQVIIYSEKGDIPAKIMEWAD